MNKLYIFAAEQKKNNNTYVCIFIGPNNEVDDVQMSTQTASQPRRRGTNDTLFCFLHYVLSVVLFFLGRFREETHKCAYMILFLLNNEERTVNMHSAGIASHHALHERIT